MTNEEAGIDRLARCGWAVRYPELMTYHDKVWGVPEQRDREVFAAYGQCILHAGLLWTATLKKRPVFAEAFEGWDIERIAQYEGGDFARLMETPGMIRNFNKLNAIITNARLAGAMGRKGSGLGEFVWRHAQGNRPVASEAAARRRAEALSDALKGEGFKFAGPATAYGLMQDIGIVNPHERRCFRSVQA